ncbi:MAG: hypothetical protein CUN52_05970 [Phototrophicales bacterium]|nr:MAG: hypothetical protein CUN52_05970 [Phototrophicales bacterium]
MRIPLMLSILFVVIGAVSAHTATPQPTPEPDTHPKILLQMSTFSPWAIMLNKDMTAYYVSLFTLYDDGQVFYYQESPNTLLEGQYYQITVDAQDFMSQFDLAELAVLDNEYIEKGLMDANTNVLKIYLPDTDSYKKIRVYGLTIPDALKRVFDTIFKFVTQPHDEAVVWTPRYVWLHLMPPTNQRTVEEQAIVDVDTQFLFEQAFAGQIEYQTPETLADGFSVLLHYDLYMTHLNPLLNWDKVRIRTSDTQLWRYWVEVVPFLP